MVWFFRDFLDGPLYLVVAFFCLIFIMAILGFMMERKQLEKEEKNRMVILNNENIKPDIDIPEEVPQAVPQSNVIEQELNQQTVTPQSVIPNEVLEKSASEGTNAKIPEILDLNSVDDGIL